MNTVASSELYRIRKTKGTYVMAGVLAALSVLGLVALMVLQHFFASDGMDLGGGTFFEGFSTYTGGTVFKMAVLLFIGSMVAKMYQSGAAKQVVSCGIKRKNIIFGQFKSLVIALSTMTVILSTVQGICNVVLGKVGSVNPLHFALSLVGMFVTVSSLTAICLLLAHLTANLALTIASGAAILVGGSTLMSTLSFFTEIDAFNDFWIGTLQANATALDVSLTTQLTSIGILAVITVVLLVLTAVVFNKKEIK